MRPNILLILTDQQSSRMMGCEGNPHVSTPAMDGLAAAGVRFGRAYCTNPVCVPSRFSLLTGRYPSEIGMRSNSSRELDEIPAHIKETALGWPARAAGYETVYGGKVHLPKGLSPEDVGFETITRDERDGLARTSSDYVSREHERPFLMVASFINPHDICYMGIRDFGETDFDRILIEKGEVEIATLDRALERPAGMGEREFFAGPCPPLPPNFRPQEDEPEAIRRLIARRPFRQKARESWPEQRWRLHRWAYRRLTEFVDAQISRLLDGLRGGPNADSTVVIFTSDHGDHDSAHMLEHKTVPYEEAARVPMIIGAPSSLQGAVDDRLVSNGLDILPTVCDYARAKVPAGLQGRSLRPLVEGREPESWRDHLLVESEIGSMVRTDRFKYVLFDDGASREQLYDLDADPYETRNAARDPQNGSVLAEHRRLLDSVVPAEAEGGAE